MFPLILISVPCLGLERIPQKLVVLTFDDSVASQFTVVRPILKKYGFGATFFITEGFDFFSDKTNYLSWTQISKLYEDGFEIGNHTRDHMPAERENLRLLKRQLEAINLDCESNGIPRPVSFAWPGNAINVDALNILKEMGIRFARRGGVPEYPYEGGRGFAYEPGIDHPLLIPAAGDGRPEWTLEDFKRAVLQARNGRIAVLQFHGVPDIQHPWVNTSPVIFLQCMKYLHNERYKVVALRDLERYVDPENWPAMPLAVIEKRTAQMERDKQASPTNYAKANFRGAREVRAMEQELADSTARNLAEDFTVNGEKGLAGKSEFLQLTRQAEPEGDNLVSFRMDDQNIRRIGNTVISTGRFLMQRSRPSGPENEESRYTFIWLLRHGHWQIVHFQLLRN
jgi:peptidoglycan/xylan/chitin deacetylase (PgdA/CDA1 family)